MPGPSTSSPGSDIGRPPPSTGPQPVHQFEIWSDPDSWPRVDLYVDGYWHSNYRSTAEATEAIIRLRSGPTRIYKGPGTNLP